jgi:hypothetical protein
MQERLSDAKLEAQIWVAVQEHHNKQLSKTCRYGWQSSTQTVHKVRDGEYLVTFKAYNADDSYTQCQYAVMMEGGHFKFIQTQGRQW